MQVGRLGSSLPLSSGAPGSACETTGWHELAPTRVIAEGQTTGGLVTTHYSAVVEGHGVYRPGEAEPMALPPLLPAMNEPELARTHMEPIERVDDQQAAVLGWTLGGLGGMGLGIGIAMAVQEQNGTAGSDSTRGRSLEPRAKAALWRSRGCQEGSGNRRPGSPADSAGPTAAGNAGA